MMGGLVAAFATQTTLVYTDDTADRTPRLSAEAMVGRAVWHRENCQTCHQIYGFGGFLGPDLTNAASRLPRTRIDAMLTEGSGQMPAFHLEQAEIEAVWAFLQAIDATGVGQARNTPKLDRTDVQRAIDATVLQHPMDAEAKSGRILFENLCTTCHCPLQATPSGAFLAPDLSDVTHRLSREELVEVLINGRPDRGMQPTALSEKHRDAVIAFFTWMAEHRGALCQAAGVSSDQQSIPWWEYR